MSPESDFWGDFSDMFTPHCGLKKPSKGSIYASGVYNSSVQTIDTGIRAPILNQDLKTAFTYWQYEIAGTIKSKD
ncbi:hypothetical protein [Leptothoe spongobia]|uniref:Uncharacterized protein n=1 Tax=Leptothoe spongobia TAU-MAC 1115 TaxID=1967444 RepID=A0A947DI06_9CYAN|nr:hypothetical protein [Leptothoe spongobia]MBT9316311.1 hypothetical protein [Leptothoe spongobia TAU-MAC 1115]